MLPAPGFHHLHLNSVDPDAAVDFYTRRFPTTEEPYTLGDTRAAMIEGPSREAIELIEVA